MVKYINKSALVAEIERRRDLHYKYYMKNGVGSIAECKYDEDREILSFLDTIDTKEVDLEKELISWHKKHFKKEGTFEKYGGFYFANSSQLDLAKHFFELGLKAKIGG